MYQECIYIIFWSKLRFSEFYFEQWKIPLSNKASDWLPMMPQGVHVLFADEELCVEICYFITNSYHIQLFYY